MDLTFWNILLKNRKINVKYKTERLVNRRRKSWMANQYKLLLLAPKQAKLYMEYSWKGA